MFQVKSIPSIPEYFAGKSIFITGGSGFLGKVFIEKILRSCPDVECIYMLLRPKKNKTPDVRIKEITNLPIFDVLKNQYPNAIPQKLKVIDGDVMQLNLGISEEDRNMLVQKVNIIVHAAASVRFDDPLNQAILMNTRGTREVCNLALDMKKIEVFLHVSTTYCQTDKVEIGEQYYPAPTDWKRSIEIAEKCDPQILNILTQKYTGALPNTYTFAKSLAEQVVHDLCDGKIPAIIVRPSIVISTYKDPMPGWIDNFNGPVGLLVGSGKGVLKICLARRDMACDYVPVDVCIKGIVLAIWNKANNKNPQEKMELEVLNLSQNQHENVTMQEIADIGRSVIDAYPLKHMIWYPSGGMTDNTTLYWLLFLVLHVVPAIFIDALLKLFGEKPILMKIQRKVFSANMSLSYFLVNRWSFLNDKSIALETTLLPQDFEEWTYDRHNIVPYEYFKNATIGGKIYLLKENMDDLEKDKAHCFRMKVLHYTTIYGSIIFVLYLLFWKINIIGSFCSWFVRYYENLPA